MMDPKLPDNLSDKGEFPKKDLLGNIAPVVEDIGTS
jgi:hypothetical protein